MGGFAQPQQQYEVLPQGTPVRGNIWISEGPVDVISSGNNWGNRFRLGGEAHFGPSYRFIAGMTLIDIISSSETSNEVGDLSRDSLDFDFGYFVVPDKIWLKYTLALQSVSGSAVTGSYTTLGHGASLGYRFFEADKFNISAEFSYLYAMAEQEPVLSVSSNTIGTVTYPKANILSLNFRFGFDLGGR